MPWRQGPTYDGEWILYRYRLEEIILWIPNLLRARARTHAHTHTHTHTHTHINVLIFYKAVCCTTVGCSECGVSFKMRSCQFGTNNLVKGRRPRLSPDGTLYITCTQFQGQLYFCNYSRKTGTRCEWINNTLLTNQCRTGFNLLTFWKLECSVTVTKSGQTTCYARSTTRVSCLLPLSRRMYNFMNLRAERGRCTGHKLCKWGPRGGVKKPIFECARV
jgi:hypothetical protein